MMPGPARAIRLERFAADFRAATAIVALEQRPPAAGEITVRNAWCGVNAIFDTQIARDAVDYVKIAPPTLTGVEAIGVVEAVGPDVAGFAIGDAAVSTRFPGGYRELRPSRSGWRSPPPAFPPCWRWSMSARCAMARRWRSRRRPGGWGI